MHLFRKVDFASTKVLTYYFKLILESYSRSVPPPANVILLPLPL